MVDPARAKSGKGKLIGTVGGGAALLLMATVAMWEGKRNDPYKDIVGVWSVCYGETRVDMRSYTNAECEDMLAEGLVDFAEPVLRRNPELKGHPDQLAAAVSLSYNIGSAAYSTSTVARRFSAGDWRGACKAFLSWDRATFSRFQPGKECIRKRSGAWSCKVKGLTRRREYENKMCLTNLPGAKTA